MKKRNRLTTVSFLLGVFFLISCLPNKAQNSVAAVSAEEQVRQVLAEQTACWSKGDIECFMLGYWKSDSLVFIGKAGLTYGWQQTLDNYKRSYPGTEAMGKLNFDILEMKPLSENTMLVVGKWMLTREEAGNLDGHFSVIFRKFPAGWRIITDHSS